MKGSNGCKMSMRSRRYGHRRANSKKSHTRRAGFTVIELMVVVAVVGAIAAIAIPSLRSQVYKAQRKEAILALHGIYQSQLNFYNETGRYADSFDQLGFELVGGSRVDGTTLQSKYYVYTLNTLAHNGVEGANFQAIATGDLDPGDEMLDILMIENSLTIVE